MRRDFPAGVVEIVRAVRQEVKSGKLLGTTGDMDEDAALEIITRIKDRGIPENCGLDPAKPEVTRTAQNIEALEWAAQSDTFGC